MEWGWKEGEMVTEFEQNHTCDDCQRNALVWGVTCEQMCSPGRVARRKKEMEEATKRFLREEKAARESPGTEVY